jgi:hypothetical protein
MWAYTDSIFCNSRAARPEFCSRKWVNSIDNLGSGIPNSVGFSTRFSSHVIAIHVNRNRERQFRCIMLP